jgi:hypothetical protein
MPKSIGAQEAKRSRAAANIEIRPANEEACQDDSHLCLSDLPTFRHMPNGRRIDSGTSFVSVQTARSRSLILFKFMQHRRIESCRTAAGMRFAFEHRHESCEAQYKGSRINGFGDGTFTRRLEPRKGLNHNRGPQHGPVSALRWVNSRVV